MSARKASGSTYDAANMKNVQQCSCDTIPRAEKGVYQAPYTPYEKCRIPGAYLIGFHPGYGADLDDQLFNAVRRDPSVRLVEDDVFGTRD